MKILALLLLFSTSYIPVSVFATQQRPQPARTTVRTVLLPGKSPLISFRILFMTGAAMDPKGKEGLASLTAAMLAQGGSQKLTYEQIINAMYPVATTFSWQVDKEMTVFRGTTHVDNLDTYYNLIKQMLLEPGFREEDFKRLRSESVNYLRISLRGGNDEELGKEVLYNMIYPTSHSYGHQNRGTISSLEALTVNDVREFYRNNYTQANLVIGIAGGYPAAFPKRVEAEFGMLSTGKRLDMKVAAPKLSSGAEIEIVQRETRSTAISFGFPIQINRSRKDWPALALVTSYLGQHRSSNGLLYQRIREARGLNYGNYAYIEYFPRGMFQFEPDPNLGRQQQIFQIWIRPVEPEHGHFTLRAALYEYDKLIREGMTQEAFEATRTFLTKYVNVLTRTQDAQLGYQIDSMYYGIPEFTSHMRKELARLTLNDVNRVIRQYLKADVMRVAIVTKDAESLRKSIISNEPSSIKYNAPKPTEILQEDKVIQSYKINIKPENVVIVPVEKVFE